VCVCSLKGVKVCFAFAIVCLRLPCFVVVLISAHQLSSFCQFDTFNGCALEIQMLSAA